MLTRRFLQTTTMLLTTLLAFATACDGDDGDTAGDSETGESGNTTGNTSGNTTDNTTGNTTGNTDDGSEACDGACANLESCGFPVDECLSFCTSGACGECLASSASCGQDCLDACAGGGDGDGDGDSGDGDGDTGVPAKECVINDDCGLGYECVACNLSDNEGWCEQTMACTWDEDCGFGGKCGYNVETSDYRCLPADYCG